MGPETFDHLTETVMGQVTETVMGQVTKSDGASDRDSDGASDKETVMGQVTVILDLVCLQCSKSSTTDPE